MHRQLPHPHRSPITDHPRPHPHPHHTLTLTLTLTLILTLTLTPTLTHHPHPHPTPNRTLSLTLTQVPACIGSSLLTAAYRGELKELVNFTMKKADDTAAKKAD